MIIGRQVSPSLQSYLISWAARVLILLGIVMICQSQFQSKSSLSLSLASAASSLIQSMARKYCILTKHSLFDFLGQLDPSLRRGIRIIRSTSQFNFITCNDGEHFCYHEHHATQNCWAHEVRVNYEQRRSFTSRRQGTGYM